MPLVDPPQPVDPADPLVPLDDNDNPLTGGLPARLALSGGMAALLCLAASAALRRLGRRED